MMDRYQQIVLASRPTGAPVAENFRLERGPMPVSADGEILVRARYLSLDPYMRGPHERREVLCQARRDR